MSNIKEVIKDLKSVSTIALDWLERVASNLINSSQDKAGDLSLEEMSRRVNLALLALQGKDVSTKAAGESGPSATEKIVQGGLQVEMVAPNSASCPIAVARALLEGQSYGFSIDGWQPIAPGDQDCLIDQRAFQQRTANYASIYHDFTGSELVKIRSQSGNSDGDLHLRANVEINVTWSRADAYQFGYEGADKKIGRDLIPAVRSDSCVIYRNIEASEYIKGSNLGRLVSVNTKNPGVKVFMLRVGTSGIYPEKLLDALESLTKLAEGKVNGRFKDEVTFPMVSLDYKGDLPHLLQASHKDHQGKSISEATLKARLSMDEVGAKAEAQVDFISFSASSAGNEPSDYERINDKFFVWFVDNSYVSRRNGKILFAAYVGRESMERPDMRRPSLMDASDLGDESDGRMVLRS